MRRAIRSLGRAVAHSCPAGTPWIEASTSSIGWIAGNGCFARRSAGAGPVAECGNCDKSDVLVASVEMPVPRDGHEARDQAALGTELGESGAQQPHRPAPVRVVPAARRAPAAVAQL